MTKIQTKKASLLLVLCFVFVAAIVPYVIPVSAAAKNPVLFIHGLTGSASNWNTMISRLVSDGWPRNILFAFTFSNPYDYTSGANARNAIEVNNWVNYILSVTGASKVDIVCHSMGGLSSRYWIKFMGGASKVDDYVSICSPHHGTTLSMFTGGDMAPGSALLTMLNSGDETPGSISYTCIWSPIDELVIPGSSGRLSGATNRMVYTYHIAALTNSQVYSIVRSAIA